MEEYILNIRHTKHSDLEANQSFKNAVGRSRECDKYSEVADNLSYVSGQSDEKVPNIEEYANDLGQKVVSLLSEQGFTGTFTVDGGYLSFEIDGEPDSIYVQSLSEIDPVWNDLDSDAATLADEVINQFYE